MSIGDNIKKLRELNDLTQTELGRIAGVSDKAVSTWENGYAEPRMGAVQKMADYFKVAKSVILDDDLDSAPLQSASPLHDRLLSLFDELNREGQNRVVNYADDLVSTGKYQKKTEESDLLQSV